jgi:hypothetical protein
MQKHNVLPEEIEKVILELMKKHGHALNLQNQTTHHQPVNPAMQIGQIVAKNFSI